MLTPPGYVLTPKISKLLQSIEGSREIIDTIEIPKEIEINIRRQSTLKSSLFSARIEGNSLNLDDLAQASTQDQKKIEVFNILKAINWILAGEKKSITQQDLLTLHTQILTGLPATGTPGKFRQEVSAIFNTAGIAIYMPPPPQEIPSLIAGLLGFTNSEEEIISPIKAVLAHFMFEKIHPFLDGNGRVGRLLMQMVLVKEGYGMKGLLTIEEFLDNHRSEYYDALGASERDVTDYVEFMLTAIAAAAQEAKEKVLAKEKPAIEDSLLPRRSEILNIIKDHQMVNFDMLRRRFMAVNERTLRYDLKKLADAGLIRKLGTTKGVYYAVLTP